MRPPREEQQQKVSTNSKPERQPWEATFLGWERMVRAGAKKKGMGLQEQNSGEDASSPKTLPEAEVEANTSISLFLPPSVSHQRPNLAGSQPTGELENEAFRG